MNYKYLLPIIILVAVLIGFGFFFKMPKTDTEVKQIENIGSVVQDSPLETSYQEYSNQNLNTGNVVLFFFANWCPTCIPVDKEIKARQGEIPQGYKIVRVNYNDNQTDQAEKDLAQKYSITYQHTFVLIDSQGQALKKWNGSGFDTILDNLK